MTGTIGSADGRPAPAEGGGIRTVVGTAFVAGGGILTTTGPAEGLLDTAAAVCGFALAAALLGCDAGTVTTVAVGCGSDRSVLDDDQLI